MTDTTVRDKIEDILWDRLYNEDNGQEISDGVQEVIEALPELTAPKVKPLIWGGVKYDCFVQCEAMGCSYELVVSDTLERSCDYIWSASVNGKPLNTPAQASFKEAKAAAQAHHDALILSALVTQETET